MSFEQVIYLVLFILSKQDNNLFKLHIKLPKRTSVGTETKQNVVSAHTETNTMGARKGRPGNGRKQVYVCGGGRPCK